jgi:hypothetical protein
MMGVNQRARGPNLPGKQRLVHPQDERAEPLVRRHPLYTRVVAFLTRLLRGLNLRFPTLFALFAILTLFDLIVPDPLPLVDELGLALLTVLLGLWRDRRTPPTARR